MVWGFRGLGGTGFGVEARVGLRRVSGFWRFKGFRGQGLTVFRGFRVLGFKGFGVQGFGFY